MLVEGCIYIIEQAAYQTMHPNVLQQQLLAAGMDDDKVEMFVAAWKAGAADLVERLKQEIATKALGPV